MPTATMHTITTHILTWINSNEMRKVNSLSFESDRLANDAADTMRQDPNVLQRTVQITPIQTQVVISQIKFDWELYNESPNKFDVFLNGFPVSILSGTVPGKYPLLVTSNHESGPYSRLLPKDSDMLSMSEKQQSCSTRKTLNILVRKTPQGYYSAVAYSTPCEITRVINTLEPGEEYRVAHVTF